MSTPSVRQRHAAEILAALGHSLRDARALSVHCANGHHVAAVYRTPEGPVVQTTPGRRAHGDRDRADTPHHGGRQPRHWQDFLVADQFADDALPAWCECGPWTLSRSQIGTWLADQERRVVLESSA